MIKKIIIGIVIVSIVGISLFLYKDTPKETVIESIEKEIKKEIVNEKIIEKCYVDVKGEVVNKGVYECVKNDKVIDVINKAGGLTKNADTNLLNLSKEVKNEMIIIVYNKKQIEDAKKRLNEPTVIEIIKEIEKECECPDVVNDACEKVPIDTEEENVNNVSIKININTASLDQLMELPKIGEAKAKAIVEFRTNEKFNSIEDIKNVSGIGDALFNDIKDLIEV